jgi:hypothetical protein
MPVAGVVVAVAGSLISNAFSSSAATNAANKQSDANYAALNLERQKDAQRKKEYDAAMAAYKPEWEAWNARRNALLARYGITAPEVKMPDFSTGPPPPPQAVDDNGNLRQGKTVDRRPMVGTTLGDLLQNRTHQMNPQGNPGLMERPDMNANERGM